jgi:hypothetical protein
MNIDPKAKIKKAVGLTIRLFYANSFFSKNAAWQLLALGFKTALAAFQGTETRF